MDRNIDKILRLADEMVEMHADLAVNFVPSDYPLDRLLTAAEYLRQAHKFIASTPNVVARTRLAALLEGYESSIKIVRAFADDLQREKILVPAPKALEKLAAVLEASMAEYRSAVGPPPPERPKPKLVIN